MNLVTVHQAKRQGASAEQRLHAHIRALAGNIKREAATAEQWENGRRWMDLARRRIHAFRHPKNPTMTESFLQTLPIPDSGSLYVDSLCLDIAGAILTRRANS